MCTYEYFILQSQTICEIHSDFFFLSTCDFYKRKIRRVKKGNSLIIHRMSKKILEEKQINSSEKKMKVAARGNHK